MGFGLNPGFLDPDNPPEERATLVSTPNSSITNSTALTNPDEMIALLLTNPDLLRKLDQARTQNPVPHERDGRVL